MRALSGLLDLLWPRLCLACGELIGGLAEADPPGAAPAPLGLCSPCLRRLRPIDPAASCATCARPLAPGVAAAGPRCGSCLADPPPFDRLMALWRYETPLKEVVHAFKFGRLDFLGEHLARALAGELGRRSPRAATRPVGPDLQDRLDLREPGILPDLLVPLPLPWPRRLARGFNQTELLAWPLAEALDLPCRRALARRFFAPRQTGQRRIDRAQAAHFRVRDAAAVDGRSVLLIDDVVTTGATVRAASRALLRAGAVRIEVAVVGATPLDDLPEASQPPLGGTFSGPLGGGSYFD
jgi:ComF family protein